MGTFTRIEKKIEKVKSILNDIENMVTQLKQIIKDKNIKKNISKPKKRQVMKCCICNKIDESYTCYCSNCGRSPHKLVRILKI